MELDAKNGTGSKKEIKTKQTKKQQQKKIEKVVTCKIFKILHGSSLPLWWC